MVTVLYRSQTVILFQGFLSLLSLLCLICHWLELGNADWPKLITWLFRLQWCDCYVVLTANQSWGFIASCKAIDFMFHSVAKAFYIVSVPTQYGIWFESFPGLEKYGKNKLEYGKIFVFKLLILTPLSGLSWSLWIWLLSLCLAGVYSLWFWLLSVLSWSLWFWLLSVLSCCLWFWPLCA